MYMWHGRKVDYVHNLVLYASRKMSPLPFNKNTIRTFLR